MTSKLISVDIFLGNRYFTTMRLAAPKMIQLGSSPDFCVDLNAVCDEVRHRIPSLRHRKDMHIYLNH